MDSRDVWTHSNPQRSADITPSKSDRRLIEWVAHASVGDPFPQPWAYASKPLESIILTLGDLGVMDRPARGAGWPAIASESSAAAKRWLEAHPEARPPGD